MLGAAAPLRLFGMVVRLPPKSGVSLAKPRIPPHLFVIDAGGTLVYDGAIDDKPSVDPADIPGARNHLLAALDAVLAGASLPTAKTASYGCSVKYEPGIHPPNTCPSIAEDVRQRNVPKRMYTPSAAHGVTTTGLRPDNISLLINDEIPWSEYSRDIHDYRPDVYPMVN